MFRYDNVVFRILGVVADLIVLNILTVLCCIPIITAGASLSAMHYCLLHIIRGEESYIWKMFFSQFKANFKAATPLWLLLLLLGIVMGMDYRILSTAGEEIPNALRYVMLVVALLLLLAVQYIIPLVARYQYTFREYITNSVLLSVAYFPRTILMVAMEIGWVLLFLMLWQYVLPIYLLCGISGLGIGRAYLYNGVFKKIENPNGEEKDGETSEKITGGEEK